MRQLRGCCEDAGRGCAFLSEYLSQVKVVRPRPWSDQRGAWAWGRPRWRGLGLGHCHHGSPASGLLRESSPECLSSEGEFSPDPPAALALGFGQGNTCEGQGRGRCPRADSLPWVLGGGDTM